MWTFFEDLTGEFTWSRWQAEPSYLWPRLLKQKRNQEIFGSTAFAAASLWVGSGVWAGFQLSRWLFGLQQSVVPRKFFLLSLLPVLISRVSSVCRAVTCSVPRHAPGSQCRPRGVSPRVYAGTSRPTPACLKYPAGEGHRALTMPGAAPAVPKWQSPTPESNRAVALSFIWFIHRVELSCFHTCLLPKVSELLIWLSQIVMQLNKFWHMNSPIEVTAIPYILQVAHALKYLAESRTFILAFTVFQK